MEAADALIAAGTDRRMGRVRRDAAAGGRGRLRAGGRRLLCSGGGDHRAVLPAQKQEKTRKKAGQVSQTRRNRREKRHEKTNTQHPAAMLHGADAAADNGVCCG